MSTISGRAGFAALAVGMLVLSACGVAAEAPLPTDATEAAVTERQEPLLGIKRTFESFYGTPDERAAAEYVIAWRLNGARSECLAKEGLDFDWRAAIFPVINPDPLYVTVVGSNPESRPFTDKALTDAVRTATERRLNDPAEDVVAAQELIAQCVKSSQSASDDQVEALRSPTRVAELWDEWSRGMFTAAIEVTSIEDYESCMNTTELSVLKGAPFTIAANEEAFLEAARRVSDLGKDADSSLQFEKLQTDEAEYLRADWACRADKYDAVIGAVGQAAEAFAGSHQNEIAQARTHWVETVEEAVVLGWSA